MLKLLVLRPWAPSVAAGLVTLLGKPLTPDTSTSSDPHEVCSAKREWAPSNRKSLLADELTLAGTSGSDQKLFNHLMPQWPAYEPSDARTLEALSTRGSNYMWVLASTLASSVDFNGDSEKQAFQLTVYIYHQQKKKNARYGCTLLFLLSGSSS